MHKLNLAVQTVAEFHDQSSPQHLPSAPLWSFVHFSSLFFRQLSSMEACFLFSVTTLGPKGFFHPSVILKDQGAEATFLQVPLCNVLQVHHGCPVMRETMHMPKRCSVLGKLRTKPETSRSGSFHSGRGFASDNWTINRWPVETRSSSLFFDKLWSGRSMKKSIEYCPTNMNYARQKHDRIETEINVCRLNPRGGPLVCLWESWTLNLITFETALQHVPKL